MEKGASLLLKNLHAMFYFYKSKQTLIHTELYISPAMPYSSLRWVLNCIVFIIYVYIFLCHYFYENIKSEKYNPYDLLYRSGLVRTCRPMFLVMAVQNLFVSVSPVTFWVRSTDAPT